MAKSKHRKARKRREQTFFEALPLSLTPPLTKPNINPDLADWRDAASNFGVAAWSDARRAALWLRRVLWTPRKRALLLALIGSFVLTGMVVGFVAATSTYALYASSLSSPAALLAKKQVGTTILDRNGNVLYEAYGGQHITVDDINALPATLKQATLAAEDANFYSEPGFSWRGTARAAFVDITQGGKFQGGSTLTQQLVKNALLTDTKSFSRKYQEIILATDLQSRYSKDQILGMYLNEVYYGEGAYGIEAASQTYFHKPASQLTLSESALLAGLPQSPSVLDPNVNKAAATDRRDYVLGRMADLHQITSAQAKAAKAEPVTTYAQSSQINAPWFVFYVLNELKAQYGQAELEKGGITVETTLDLPKEQTAEQIVTNQINTLASHNVTNGALVSLDPKTGDILAMVGSANYNAPGWGAFNVAAQGERQPGSSFKPFAYVTAFEKGWTGASTVVDEPITLPSGAGPYTPENYDLKFHGTVTLRHALDNSLNIPAIKVVQFAGVNDTIATANSLGATLDAHAETCGVTLVLGCADVTPLDMATGYATFDNNGVRVNPQSILKVSDRYGKNITKTTATSSKQAIDPRYAYMITNILSDNQARLPEFPETSPLKLTTDPNSQYATEIPAAAKTGTTNDFRDNWTVGYTPNVVTAVWVGNSDNSPMENVDGITGAAPIWHDYMESVVASQPVTPFIVPSGITFANVCTSTGYLADGSMTSGITSEPFATTTSEPTQHCSAAPLITAPVTTSVPTAIVNTLKGLLNQDTSTDGSGSTPATPTPTPYNRNPGNPFGF